MGAWTLKIHFGDGDLFYFGDDFFNGDGGDFIL